MLLSILSLEKWGPFVKEEIAFLDGMTVLFGGNETGKTWILKGLASALFGFEDPQSQWFQDARSKEPSKVELTFSTGSGHFTLTRILQGTTQIQRLTKAEEEGSRCLSESAPDVARFILRELGMTDPTLARALVSPGLFLSNPLLIESAVSRLEKASQRKGGPSPSEAAIRLRERVCRRTTSTSGASTMEALKRNLAAAEEALGSLAGLREEYEAQRSVLQDLTARRRASEEEVSSLEQKMSHAERRSAAEEQMKRWTERSRELNEMCASLEEAQKRIESIDEKARSTGRMLDLDLDSLLARADEVEKARELLKWRKTSYEEARNKVDAEKSALEASNPLLMPLVNEAPRRQALKVTLEAIHQCEERMLRAQRARLAAKQVSTQHGVAKRMKRMLSDRKQEEDLKDVEERMMTEMERLEESLDLELKGMDSASKPEEILAEAERMVQKLDEITLKRRDLEGVGAEVQQRDASLAKRESELLAEAEVQSVVELKSRVRSHKDLQTERSRWAGVLAEGIASKGLESWREEAAKAQNMVDRLQAELEELSCSDWTEQDEESLSLARATAENLVRDSGEADGKLRWLRDRLRRGPSELEGIIQYFKDEISAVERDQQAAEMALSVLDALEGEVRESAAPILERAVERLMAVLTSGKHTRVSVRMPWPSLKILVRGEEPAEPACLGTGTQSGLETALRLAVLSLLCPDGQCPLILDSPLMGLDDERRRALLSVMVQSVKHGRQVILTTHWPGVEETLQVLGQGVSWRCAKLGIKRKPLG